MRCGACGRIVIISEGPAFKNIFGKSNRTGVILENKALCLDYTGTRAVN